MSTSSKINRSWCYTINNYTQDDIVALESIPCKVHICGKEVCNTTQTPHLQGYIRFEKPQRFSWWKLHFPRAHVEMRHGSEAQAFEYCTKENNIVIHKGEPSKNINYGNRNEEATAVIDKIHNGVGYWQIRKEHPLFVFWNRRNVLDYIADSTSEANGEDIVSSYKRRREGL